MSRRAIAPSSFTYGWGLFAALQSGRVHENTDRILYIPPKFLKVCKRLSILGILRCLYIYKDSLSDGWAQTEEDTNVKAYQETRVIMYDRIRKLRKNNHITQAQLASQLGISRRTYANYERGVHAMPAEILVRIADTFDTSLDYLTGRS